jgi:hypothetical protein
VRIQPSTELVTQTFPPGDKIFLACNGPNYVYYLAKQRITAGKKIERMIVLAQSGATISRIQGMVPPSDQKIATFEDQVNMWVKGIGVDSGSNSLAVVMIGYNDIRLSLCIETSFLRNKNQMISTSFLRK